MENNNMATSLLFDAFWGNPRNPRLTGSQGTLKLTQNSLKKLPDPTAVPHPGGGLRPSPGWGGRTACLVVFSSEF